MHRLPAPAVIEARPGGDRPGVVELPVERAHAMGFERAPVIHRRADRQRLLHLAEIDEAGKACGKAEIAEHRAGDALIAADILLVQFHDRRSDVEIALAREGAYHRQRGIGLETEFRAETRAHRAVFAEGLVLVPDGPVMHVAGTIRMPGIAVIEITGGRARRPPDSIRRRLLHLLLDHPVQPVISNEIAVAIVARFFEPGERAHQLVIAAPQRYRGMAGEPLDLILDLMGDVFEEILGAGVEVAGEHEVLPDHQPHAVAEIIEPVMLVKTAAPDADHVHMRIDGRLQQRFRPLRRTA